MMPDIPSPRRRWCKLHSSLRHPVVTTTTPNSISPASLRSLGRGFQNLPKEAEQGTATTHQLGNFLLQTSFEVRTRFCFLPQPAAEELRKDWENVDDRRKLERSSFVRPSPSLQKFPLFTYLATKNAIVMIITILIFILGITRVTFDIFLFKNPRFKRRS